MTFPLGFFVLSPSVDPTLSPTPSPVEYNVFEGTVSEWERTNGQGWILMFKVRAQHEANYSAEWAMYIDDGENWYAWRIIEEYRGLLASGTLH